MVFSVAENPRHGSSKIKVVLGSPITMGIPDTFRINHRFGLVWGNTAPGPIIEMGTNSQPFISFPFGSNFM